MLFKHSQHSKTFSSKPQRRFKMASFPDNLNTPHEETDDDFDTDSYNCNENLLILQNQMYLEEVRRASLLVSDAEFLLIQLNKYKD